MLVLLLVLGCVDPVDLVPDDSGTGDSDTAPAQDSEPTDTAPGWWEAPPGDADGDGLTVAQGDCDDTDPAVHPGLPDTCDGRDSDCDGAIDEDAAPDTWEPNDLASVNLGDRTEEPETLVHGYLFPEGDVDRFSLYVEDGDFSWFSLEAWLYGVPADADYRLELIWTADASGAFRGTVATADALGDGGWESLDWGGLLGRDDSGWYEVVVDAVDGSGCAAPYTLQILVGGL